MGNVLNLERNTGGIVGLCNNTNIINCKNTGNIESKHKNIDNGCCGGIVGRTNKVVTECENKGNINYSNNVQRVRCGRNCWIFRYKWTSYRM